MNKPSFEVICPDCALKGKADFKSCKCKAAQRSGWRSPEADEKWRKELERSLVAEKGPAMYTKKN